MRPPVGICIPVRYVRCRDGDTVEVSLPKSEYVYAVRLADCWCPEMREEGGVAAKEFAESVLDNTESLHLFIPLDGVGVNILAALTTFDRVVGELWVSSTKTLNEMLIEAGYASREKPR